MGLERRESQGAPTGGEDRELGLFGDDISYGIEEAGQDKDLPKEQPTNGHEGGAPNHVTGTWIPSALLEDDHSFPCGD